MMFEQCKAEVVDLHAFLVNWMSGTLPRTADTFARFTQVLSNGFIIIDPSGEITERDDLSAGLEAAYGGRGGRGERSGARGSFRIEIKECQFIHGEGDVCLMTYEEWQHQSDSTNGRLSKALFRRREGLPHGVEWVHLHENWVLGAEAGAGSTIASIVQADAASDERR